MLASNLAIPDYVALVTKERESPADALARAAKHAGPFNTWLKSIRPELIGRLPTKLLREEGSINQLVDTFRQQCRQQVEPLGKTGGTRTLAQPKSVTIRRGPG